MATRKVWSDSYEVLGDPIVFGGQKYRIRERVGRFALRVARAPKRRATHRVSFYGQPEWDSVAGLWRLSGSYSLTQVMVR